MAQKENRKHLRVPVDWPVTLQTDRGSMDGIALNISSGGAFVRFKRLIPKGETLGMTLKPPNHTSLKVTIETVWTDKYISSGKEIKPIGMGVHFAKVSDVDRQFVSTVVADLLKLEYVKESCERPIACVVLPTYNEAANIPIIIPAIFRQQDRIDTHDLHVLVVDDNSPDGTQDVVRGLQPQYPQLHLITGPKIGLGEAYKKGMGWAIEHLKPELLFEMDADLQHDPELIPLFITLTGYGFSVVIGSRFAPGGDTPDFSLRRRLISRVGNWMIRFLGGIPRIADCTSGYRCIRVDLIRKCDLTFMSTRGYSFQCSLLCELIRNRARVIEIPIIFQDRKYGESKLSLRDQVEFLLNIPRIRFNSSRELVKSCIVGVSGVLVNMGIYAGLTRLLGIPLEYASPVAIELSILSNFFLNHLWTFKWRQTTTSWRRKLVQFHLVSSMAAVVNYVVLLCLARVFGVWDIAANLAGIAAGTVINYGMNSLWTWKSRSV